MPDGRKRIIIQTIMIVVTCTVVMVCGNIYIIHGMAEQRKQEVEGLVGFLVERYPELNEQELVESLQGRLGDAALGNELLAKYGYDEDYYRFNMREGRGQLMLWNGAVVFAAVLFGVFFRLRYEREQRRKLCGISNYLHELNNHDYTLKIEDNGEDELSLLRNEIYKTTILLRETSEYEAKLNRDLQRSMEDISHQLRTPLASITIMLDNIYDNPDMPMDMRQDFIHSISTQIGWITSLVNSMLKLAEFDAGVIQMNEEEIHVSELVADSLDKLSVVMEIKNVQVILEENAGRNDVATGEGEHKESKDIIFMGDYTWQMEAVTNIIKNAIEHSHDGGRVWLKVSQK